MSEYVRLSRLVDKAITSRDAELAKTLRHELQPLQDEDRYKLLASRLDLIPDEPLITFRPASKQKRTPKKKRRAQKKRNKSAPDVKMWIEDPLKPKRKAVGKAVGGPSGLARPPRFQGGHKLSGGLPGSKR